jgi:hypothetical protein
MRLAGQEASVTGRRGKRKPPGELSRGEVLALMRRAYDEPIAPPPSLMQMARARARRNLPDVGHQPDATTKEST